MVLSQVNDNQVSRNTAEVIIYSESGWLNAHGRNSVTAWLVVPVLQVTIVPVPRRPGTAQPSDEHHQMHKI